MRFPGKGAKCSAVRRRRGAAQPLMVLLGTRRPCLTRGPRLQQRPNWKPLGVLILGKGKGLSRSKQSSPCQGKPGSSAPCLLLPFRSDSAGNVCALQGGLQGFLGRGDTAARKAESRSTQRAQLGLHVPQVKTDTEAPAQGEELTEGVHSSELIPPPFEAGDRGRGAEVLLPPYP